MEKEKLFKDCTLTFLEDNFQLEEVKHLEPLNNWLVAPTEITDLERQILAQLRELLDFNVHDWNEQELEMHFIGPVFSLVNFSSKKFNIFAEREVKGMVDDWQMSGYPDNMVASGRREPKSPYFVFQEYKKKKDPKGDPAAQALAAMLVGQSINQNANPIYGCYVIGNDWRFMVLSGKQFSQSSEFDASSDDIYDIFSILKSLKQIVFELTFGN